MIEESLAKVNLAMYMPSLFKLTGLSGLPWKDYDMLYNAEIQRRLIEGKGQPVMIEATIYDIIIEAKKKNNSAIGLLHFLNLIFEDLSFNLREVEKGFVLKNISDMLSTMNMDYLNYVGEIATLNNLMKSKAYRLEGVEAPIGNGKSVDFKLLNIEEGKIYLAEVVNIHIDEERVEADPDMIYKFFTYRFQKKIDKKMEGLNGEPPFHLIPVLWGGHAAVKIYAEYFRNNKLKFPKVIEPVAYLMKSDGAGYFEHDFKIVSSLM